MLHKLFNWQQTFLLVLTGMLFKSLLLLVYLIYVLIRKRAQVYTGLKLTLDVDT